MACREQKFRRDVATLRHCGSGVFAKAPFWKYPPISDPLGPGSPQRTSPESRLTGDNISATPLPYSMFAATTLAGCPVLALMMKLVCQPSTTRASTPELFDRSSLFGPIG